MTWHAKATGRYLPTSSQAYDNAMESMTIMMNDYGWTKEACCGVFGNIDHEGEWNPWRWQSDNVRSVAQSQSDHDPLSGHGYGLIGWTPSGKYCWDDFTFTYQRDTYRYFPGYHQQSYPGYGPNFSDRVGNVNDGAAQIKLICEGMLHHNINMYNNRTGCSYDQYIALTDVEDAAYHWLRNAENPANWQSKVAERKASAVAWYKRLPDTPSGSFPYIILVKKSLDRMQGLW